MALLRQIKFFGPPALLIMGLLLFVINLTIKNLHEEPTILSQNISASVLTPQKRSRNITNHTYPKLNFLIMEEHFCTDLPLPVETFSLAYVHSNPLNVKQRQFIRSTWGNKVHFHQTKLLVVFVIGKHPYDIINRLIGSESEFYHDVIQVDFIDDEANLTYKALSALYWVKENCPQAAFVLKTDDNVLLNTLQLMPVLQTSLQPMSLLCMIRTNMKPIRKSGASWYVSTEEFPDEVYPPHCSGSAFFMTSATASALYDVHNQFPYFRLDNIYVTGLLTEASSVVLENFRDHYKLSDACRNEKLMNHEKIFVATFSVDSDACKTAWQKTAGG